MLFPEYQKARRISIYMSMPNAEISTRAIVLHALEQNKKVFVPFTYKISTSKPDELKSRMDMVSLHSIKDYESLQADAWGIPTPNETTIRERDRILGNDEIEMKKAEEFRLSKEKLDLILMPGVAFDHALSRLGHGKGYYDSFLQLYRQAKFGKDNAETKMPFLGGLEPLESCIGMRILTN